MDKKVYERNYQDILYITFQMKYFFINEKESFISEHNLKAFEKVIVKLNASVFLISKTTLNVFLSVSFVKYSKEILLYPPRELYTYSQFNGLMRAM